jgi:hypothetical protein
LTSSPKRWTGVSITLYFWGNICTLKITYSRKVRRLLRPFTGTCPWAASLFTFSPSSPKYCPNKKCTPFLMILNFWRGDANF